MSVRPKGLASELLFLSHHVACMAYRSMGTVFEDSGQSLGASRAALPHPKQALSTVSLSTMSLSTVSLSTVKVRQSLVLCRT